jgi:hypothetical protein
MKSAYVLWGELGTPENIERILQILLERDNAGRFYYWFWVPRLRESVQLAGLDWPTFCLERIGMPAEQVDAIGDRRRREKDAVDAAHAESERDTERRLAHKQSLIASVLCHFGKKPRGVWQQRLAFFLQREERYPWVDRVLAGEWRTLKAALLAGGLDPGWFDPRRRWDEVKDEHP